MAAQVSGDGSTAHHHGRGEKCRDGYRVWHLSHGAKRSSDSGPCPSTTDIQIISVALCLSLEFTLALFFFLFLFFCHSLFCISLPLSLLFLSSFSLRPLTRRCLRIHVSYSRITFVPSNTASLKFANNDTSEARLGCNFMEHSENTALHGYQRCLFDQRLNCNICAIISLKMSREPNGAFP